MPDTTTDHPTWPDRIRRARRWWHTTHWSLQVAAAWRIVWLPIVLAAPTISHHTWTLRFAGVAALAALFTHRSYRRAIGEVIWRTVAIVRRDPERVRHVLAACRAVGEDPTTRTIVYPDVIVTIGPLKRPRRMLAALIRPRPRPTLDGVYQATHRTGGLAAMFQPEWEEWNVAPLPNQQNEHYRGSLEKALKRHLRYPSVSSHPLDDERIVVRLAGDRDPYSVTVTDDDYDPTALSEEDL